MKYIKGLRIDWENVEGEVKLPEELEAESALFQTDVLKDWLYDIRHLYRKALKDFRVEARAMQKMAEKE
jgi:hypothetical protein